MKSRINAALTMLIIGLALLLNGAGTAHATQVDETTTTTVQADQPPTFLPTVTCTKIEIDPPAWVGVKAVGTIGTHDVELLLHHVAGTTPPMSEVDITDYTGAVGTIHVKVHALWSLPPNPYHLGSGPGPDVEVDLECHQAPKPPARHTCNDGTVISIAAAKAGGCPTPTPPMVNIGTAVTTTTVPAATRTLPLTGSSTPWIALVGTSTLLAGIALLLIKSIRDLRRNTI